MKRICFDKENKRVTCASAATNYFPLVAEARGGYENMIAFLRGKNRDDEF